MKRAISKLLVVVMVFSMLCFYQAGKSNAVKVYADGEQEATVEPTTEITTTVEPTTEEPTTEIIYNYKESEYSSYLNS